MGIFRASLQHNESYAFREYPMLTKYQQVHQGLVPDISGASHPSIIRCDQCGELTSKWDEPLSGLVIKKRKYDVSVTYDGVLIVSERFKLIYAENELSGLEFRQLPDDSPFFSVLAARAVEFDAERRKTEFTSHCSQCGCYESVVGATPVFLKAGCLVGSLEFVRTDLEFGSGDGKHPLLLCGQSAAKAISDAKLKGLDLIAIKQDEIQKGDKSN